MALEATWSGKVCVVTGASSGIGAAIAKKLAAAGMKVVACARRRDRLDALAAESAGSIIAKTVDLRDEASIKSMFDDIRATVGPVAVLVNNAGLGHAAPLIDGDAKKWREMLEVNVLGLCIATREALASMRESGEPGYIIHISSMAAHRVPRGSGVYSATKFAVRSLTDGLRQELYAAELPVRVTSVSPGFVETEFAEHYHQSREKAHQTYSRYPVLTADDVADTALFLLSQPARVQYHDILLRPTRQPD